MPSTITSIPTKSVNAVKRFADSELDAQVIKHNETIRLFFAIDGKPVAPILKALKSKYDGYASFNPTTLAQDMSAVKKMNEVLGSAAQIDKAVNKFNKDRKTPMYNVRSLVANMPEFADAGKPVKKAKKSVGTLRAELDKTAAEMTDAQVDAWYAKHVAARKG